MSFFTLSPIFFCNRQHLNIFIFYNLQFTSWLAVLCLFLVFSLSPFRSPFTLLNIHSLFYRPSRSPVPLSLVLVSMFLCFSFLLFLSLLYHFSFAHFLSVPLFLSFLFLCSFVYLFSVSLFF